ncbi:RDD family protein [Soonwooa sp.]|uniref:RDD family protein n=1 Tax=Soonwooa sp. TaxID=1938592 RepID=UPI00262A7484|nr:RDD family protein [Soonwooa sp.]
MNQIDINTSQNVNINFKTASLGERFFAFVIDMLIKGAYGFAIFWLLFDILGIQRYFSGLDDWSSMAFMAIIMLPTILYTLVLESLFEGQTPGKKLMKIRVVKIDGYQASFGDYFMRWLMRLIDLYTNFGVVGLISMVVSQKNQRLGDVVSGCAVISLKSDVNISHTILQELKEDYVAVFPQVILLNDNDMRIIKENYERAVRTKDSVIIKKLADKIRQTIKLDHENKDYTDLQFINVVIKDYNFYTGKNS